MARLYGLSGQAQEDMSEMVGTNSTTKAYNALKTRKLGYLKMMREYLSTHYPAYVEQHTRKVQASRASRYANISIPVITMKKLEQATQTLLERGEALSMNKLRKLSGVNTRYASAYLCTLKEKESA